MNKKTLYLLIATTCFGVSNGNNARAQFVVSDPTNLAQNVAQAVSAAATLEQMITMVVMLTASYGVNGLLGGLNQANQYPNTNQLTNQLFDTSMPASAVAGSIAQDADRQIVGTDSNADLLKVQIAGLANSAGIAAKNLEALDDRLRENAETLRQLSTSRNIMQATVTNGLVMKQVHDAVIMNTQATNHLIMTVAQASLHEEEEAARQRKMRQDTALLFGAAAVR